MCLREFVEANLTVAVVRSCLRQTLQITHSTDIVLVWHIRVLRSEPVYVCVTFQGQPGLSLDTLGVVGVVLVVRCSCGACSCARICVL